MSAIVQKCGPSRVIGEAFAAYRLVRRDTAGSTNEAMYCDAGERAEGVIGQAASADDVTDQVTIAVNDLLLAEGTLRMVASGAISQGAEVFSDDDGKVTATNTGFRVGRLRDMSTNTASADGDVVEVVPDPAFVAYANTAASAEVENTVTETAFDQSFTIPANSLKVGDVLHIRAHAHVVDQNSTDTLTLRLKIGSVTVYATAAVDVADDDIAIIDAYVVVRAIGATGTIFGSILAAFDAAGTAAGSQELAATTLDTTADAAVTVTAQWSVAHADNEVRLDALVVEKISG